ncbi:MAG: ParB N-terminal domain-containing protein [Myxococcales bacterium]|nr:ParB N-terminal domain-containing protein [Myxococcales bacterium]
MKDVEADDGHSAEGAPQGAPPPPEAVAAPAEARPRKSHVAPALVPIDRVDDDPALQMRPVGDVSHLATDLARLGQVFPIELRLKPPDRFQVICGFRRVAALRFLQRDKVLARLHTDLSDEDALLMALAAAIHSEPVTRAELSRVKERLEAQGRLTAAARDMLEKALATGAQLAPEGVEEEEEIDADELAADLAVRQGEINQDLALLAEVFGSLEEERREELLKQLRYSAELVAYLEGR